MGFFSSLDIYFFKRFKDRRELVMCSHTTTSLGFRSLDHLSHLIHLIYDAGIHPERWVTAVAAIAESFNTTKALLFTPTLAPQHGGIIFPAGITENSIQLWASKYLGQDPWIKAIEDRDLWKQGGVARGDDLVPRKELETSKYYQEFLQPIGTTCVCAGFVFENGPATKGTVLSVYRDKHESPFSQDDMSWMRILISHLSRSLGVMQRLEMARIQRASLLASFDRLQFGVVLLDSRMYVLHLNRPAQAVMHRNDGLRIESGQLADMRNGVGKALPQSKGTRPKLISGLNAWLTKVNEGLLIESNHFLDGYVVSRDDNLQYIVQCSTISPKSNWIVNDASVAYIAFIHDPAAIRLPSVKMLMEIYGLTRAEAKVALAFATGCSYGEVAIQLHISEETVRSHVKELYPQLRVHRQADLVRLILSLATNAV